jgi:signal transduction histidine kinase
MYRSKLLFLIVLLAFPVLLPAGTPVVLNRIFDFSEINSGVEYYTVPAKKTPGIVVAQPGAAILKAAFQPMTESSPITRANFLNDFYFRFTVSNTGATKDSALFYPGVVIESEVYRVDTANGTLHTLPDSFSYTTQVSNQEIRLPFIKLNPGETQVFLVHPHFHYYNYMEWRPTLVRKEQLLQLTYNYKIRPELSFLFITLFFLGILCTMFTYAIIKAYQTRLKEFTFYALSVLCFIFYFGYQLTLLFNFANWYHGLDLFMKQFFQIGAHIFYMLFATYFLNLRKNLPVLFRIMKIIYVILAVYLVIVFATSFNERYFELNMQLFNSVRILLLLYSLYAIPVLFRCKIPLAKYIAYGATAVSIFAAFAFYYSNVPEGFSPFFASIGGPITLFKLGLLIEQVFFTMGLAKKSQVEEGYRVKAVEMLRIDNEKKEFEKFMAVMETKEKERTRIAQEIHDDIGSGLTTIRLLSEIAQGKGNNGKSGEMEKISASANELIENMNEIIWSFNARNDTLPNLVAYIRRYVVGYFEPTDIMVKIIIPNEIPPVQISGDFRRSVFLVIKESIHNIMKHAKATEIILHVAVSGGLTISIKDNGAGFNNEAVKLFSNGLRSMRERMEHIGGRFEISGHHGTEVILELPV